MDIILKRLHHLFIYQWLQHVYIFLQIAKFIIFYESAYKQDKTKQQKSKILNIFASYEYYLVSNQNTLFSLRSHLFPLIIGRFEFSRQFLSYFSVFLQRYESRQSKQNRARPQTEFREFKWGNSSGIISFSNTWFSLVDRETVRVLNVLC